MVVEVRGSVEDGSEAPGSLTVMEGAVDLSTSRGWLTVKSGFVESGREEGRATCGIRFDRSARYFEVSGGAGASWLRIDEAEASIDDPTSWVGASGAFLEHLRGVSEDVEVLGEEEVRGVTTTHYRFTVSAERLRAAEESEPDFLEAFEVESLPSEVWVDGDGLPRRMTFALDRSLQGTDLRIVVLAEFSDFGGPVEIEVPPEGDITPAEDSTQAALSCFGGIDVPGGGSSDVVTPSILLAVVSAAKDIAAGHGSYDAVTADLLRERLREFGGDRIGLEVVGEGPSAGPRSVSVVVVRPNEIRMAILDEEGGCVGVRSLLRPEPGSLGAFFASRDVGDDACRAELFSTGEYTLSIEEIAIPR